MFIYKQITLNYGLELRAGLLHIYGVGWHKSIFICARIGLFYPFYISNLNIYNWCLLSFILDFFTALEIRIKRVIYQNIKKKYDISSYTGIRHKDSLPVRGQRTRTNASTRKRYKIILND